MKKSLSLLVTLTIFVAIPANSIALSLNIFKDTQGHWAQNYINQLSINCDVKGYTDANGQFLNEFHPDQSMTRAELVTTLVKCKFKGQPLPTTTTLFPDVKVGSWYAPYVTKAAQQNWVSGYKDGTFHPEKPLTRAEAVKVILLSQFPADQVTADIAEFIDVKPTSWYYPYISFAVARNFVEGYKNISGQLTGKFGPDNFITRAEIAKVVANTYGWSLITTPPPVTSSTPTIIGKCQIFPSDNAWNRDISNDPIDPNSQNYMNAISIIGGNQNLHADFGGAGEYGIPLTIVHANQALVPVTITDYPQESDAGPFPIPANAKIEPGDGHVLVLDDENCMLYELYGAAYSGGNWTASSSAKFDLKSNALRPDGWTSADAAGLPIAPGLANYDQVAAGAMNHALRFTLKKTQKAYIHPATHYASSNTDANLPPMGLRLRLKADFDTSKFTGQSKIILETLKKYGMFVADNGSNYFISGTSDTRWNDEDLNQLKTVPGSAFEVVQTGAIIK